MSATPDILVGELAPAPEPPASAPALSLVDLFSPAPLKPPGSRALRVSVVIPATNTPETLERCLTAVRQAAEPPGEIVVVDEPATAVPSDPRNGSPLARAAAARNAGAELATGDVLVFIDADVEVHPDVFVRIRDTLREDAAITAIFGSYDNDPGDGGVVSQFRNLLHHHVHQNSPGTIGTFWTGLGAIRREAFVLAGGFPERPMEDVEFGMRLAATGASIVLDPRVQGKHLKGWTVLSMVRTDLLMRGAPWVALALRNRSSAAVLNLGWRHRMSAAASVWTLTAIVRRRPRSALGALGVFVGLNRSFYRLLLRRRGPGTAAIGVTLHLLHHLTGVAAVPAGVALYAAERRREPTRCDSDSSA